MNRRLRYHVIILFICAYNTVGGTEVWVLHDHQRIRTVKARTPRRDLLRQHSMLSAGSENLGFIPEYSTLPNKHSTQTAVHSDYITLPNKRSARNHSAHRELPNDNPEASIGSAADLHLNLSDLDASVSSDQFSLRKSSMTRKFYETFGTPRSVSQTSFADSYRSDVVGGSGATDWHVDDVHTLSYSYPNISLADEFSAASLSARAKEAKGTRGRFTSPNKQKEKQRTGGFQPDPAHLFSQTRPLPMRYGPEPDLWNSNRPIDKPRDTRFSNSRVKYLTQIKFGETVRLKEEAKKKRKREKRKGTIRYAFRSDVKGEKY